MASESSVNGGHGVNVEKPELDVERDQTADSEPLCPPPETRPQSADRNGPRAPSLSQCSTTAFSKDSGFNSIEPSLFPKNHDTWRSDTCEADVFGEEANCTNGFSEEYLLNITFEACDTTGKGEVQASTIMQYLQDMTAQSPDQEKLTALYNMLDPDRTDRTVNRDTFHSTMRMWIAQCSQNSMHEDCYQSSGADLTRVPINGIDFSPPETEAEFPEGGDGRYCEWKDLLGTIAELKHTRERLSEQNSSLLRSLAQCEDANLQLTLEVTELRTKLASTQRSVARARTLSEELDEARRGLRDSQERASRAQANSCKLIKESECLKAHIKLIEDANEKLSHERTCAEGRVSKLMKMNSEIREELDETLVLLAEKDSEITKKTMFIDEMRISRLGNLKIIEGMQSELMRLQENSRQELLRFDRCSVSSQGSLGRCDNVPHVNSLQSEIQETQKQRVSADGVSSPICGILPQHGQRDDFQRILPQIKSLELLQLFHTQPGETDALAGSMVDVLERAYLQCQQQQASTKQQLANVERELELQMVLREEVEGKLGEQQRMLAEAHKQTQEAKKTAALNWWRALKVEEDKTRAREEASQASQARAEIEDRLQCAEATIQELREQVRHLEAALKTAQEQLAEFRSEVEREAAFSKANDSHPVREGGDRFGTEQKKQLKDVAVVTDPVETCKVFTEVDSPLDSHDSTAETLLETWRRVELMVSRASEAADLLTSSHQRLSKAKDRMEASTKRVEQALSRAAEAEAQWSQVEARITERTEPTGPSRSSDLGSVGKTSTESGGSEKPRSPAEEGPVRQTYPVSSCHPVNGGIISPGVRGGDSRTKDSNSFGTACLTDTPVQARPLSCGVHSWPNSNDDSARPPLLEPAKAQRTSESDTHCVVPLSNGPRPEERHPYVADDDHESRAQEDVGGSEVPARSDSCQSEPADYGRRQAKVTQSPADLVQTREDQTPQCSTLRGLDCPPEANVAAVATAHHSPAQSPIRNPRIRPPLTPAMPTLPEEEEDSPEELDSSSSSPITCTPVENKVVTMPLPTPSIVFPVQDITENQDTSPLEQARPLSPRPRLSRNSPSSGSPITTVDSAGHVIDLVKDQLPDLQLSAEDKRKNLELLEEAKKVSDRFLTRRGRRSTCSLSDSPTGPSPNLTPHSSPVPSRSSSLTVPPQAVSAPEEPGVNYVNPPASQLLEVRAAGEQEDMGPLDQESLRKMVDWKPKEKRKVSSGTLSPRHVKEGSMEQKEIGEPRLGGERGRKGSGAGEEEGPGRSGPRRAPEDDAPATGVAKPVPRPAAQQVPCTAEIRTIGAFPPLMRAVSWETVSSFPARNGTQDSSPKGEEAVSFFDKSSDSLLKSSGYKDFPVQPMKMQKLAKMREEHKLIRNQSIVGSKLPDLSETAEQERGPSPCPPLASTTEEEAKEKSDVMPNISDVMLRKLKLHRALPGSAPPLTEKEVENTFVQLSLAFRNDSYTLETRLRQAERERNLTEENTEKELEEFKNFLKGSASLWQTSEQRESYQRLLETVAILHRLATRLSSRAEMVGAVRQERRMNKATEVMMQYVENLKRTYEKDHAELMEFKKLANQNSNRCYGGSIDTGDDGVPRTSRSLSLTLGKALPRRRVSVAVVPKFNLLNIPGQTPPTATAAPLPVLCEANSTRCSPPTETTQQTVAESGKAPAEAEAEASIPAKPPSNPTEITSEMKAKIEEDAYNKGYQEGLKRCKELQEVKEEEEKTEESQEEQEEKECLEAKEQKHSSKYEKVLDVLDRLCPKVFRQNRLFWIVLTLFAVTFFVASVFTYFSDRHSELGDVSAGKTMGPGKKKFFGWNVRFQPKNPTPE